MLTEQNKADIILIIFKCMIQENKSDSARNIRKPSPDCAKELGMEEGNFLLSKREKLLINTE